MDAPSLEVIEARLDEEPEQPDLVGSISAHGMGLELEDL